MKIPRRYSRPAALLSLTLACAIAHAAEPPQWLSFPKETPLNVSLTLLPLQGKVGRERPFYNGYRPQLRFAGMKDEVTCALTLPAPRDKVEPGETAELAAACIDSLKLRDDQLEFGVYEGGRKVGHGRLKPR
jgi:hypothetical protein